MRADRQTDKQTYRHAHHNTSHSKKEYFSQQTSEQINKKKYCKVGWLKFNGAFNTILVISRI